MISISTDEALQLLANGWTVRAISNRNKIEWRSPQGLSEADYQSESLDCPPQAVLTVARQLNQIVDYPRTLE